MAVSEDANFMKLQLVSLMATNLIELLVSSCRSHILTGIMGKLITYGRKLSRWFLLRSGLMHRLVLWKTHFVR